MLNVKVERRGGCDTEYKTDSTAVQIMQHFSYEITEWIKLPDNTLRGYPRVFGLRVPMYPESIVRVTLNE